MRLLQVGRSEGRRPDNPVERLPKLRPTPDPVYDDIWSQAELDLLVAGTRKMESPLRERLRVLTMMESGARAGEMRGLQLGDFDLYRKTITVLGKGRKKRLIGISPEHRRRVPPDGLPNPGTCADRERLPLVSRLPRR